MPSAPEHAPSARTETTHEMREREAWRGFVRLAHSIETAERHGLRAAVVGGVAIFMHAGAPFSPLRENGTVRDLDVLVLSDPAHLTPSLETLAKETGIPASFTSVKPHGAAGKTPLQIVREITKEEHGGAEKYFLSFRGVQVPIPPETLTVEHKNLAFSGETVVFPTFPALTILHLYLTRTGSLKPKDLAKLRRYARFLRQEGAYQNKDCGHARYRCFHAFAREVNARYPGYRTAMRAFHHLDAACSGLLAQKAVPRWLFRILTR